jgi:hypothetical protein
MSSAPCCVFSDAAAPLPAAPPVKQNWLEVLRDQAGRRNNGSSAPKAAAAPAAAADPNDPTAAANENEPLAAGPEEPQHRFKVLYRFNEGYTNAVKKPITMRELL